MISKRDRLTPKTVVCMTNPWSRSVIQTTWGAIREHCNEYVHPKSRLAWIREARQAAHDADWDTLGSMVIGS